ncbi:hypothetical protein Tco_0659984 [Tanacetum coccineum]
MPKSIHVDHQDTAYYIPKYHKTEGLNDDECAIYKNLERRYFHEGHVVNPSYLEDQPNLRQTFTEIKFDCLLDINEQICPVFVLQFYKSVRLIRNLNGTLSIAFIINNVEICLRLESLLEFFMCLVKDPSIMHNTLFYKMPPGKTRKVKGESIVLDPFQMVLSELKLDLKKWETILSENIIGLSGNKDHPNACLSYMLYCLTIRKQFNLAYYIAKRIESVTKRDVMALPYGMLLTRLYKLVCTTHPYAISDLHHLVDHVMIPLTEV